MDQARENGVREGDMSPMGAIGGDWGRSPTAKAKGRWVQSRQPYSAKSSAKSLSGELAILP